MEWLNLITLALVQGITEFLPISSSAHLILVPALTGWADQGLLFDISVHVGTLAAVMVYFHRDVAALSRGGYDLVVFNWQSPDARLVRNLAISTLPLLILALFIKDAVELVARNVVVIAIASIGFGLLLWLVDRNSCPRPRGRREVDKLSTKEALVFGLFQALALIPGTSRSGITMTAGRALGFSRTQAARYSMLMAIPVIIIAAVYSLYNDFHLGMSWQDNRSDILLGAGLSFVAALAAIHLLMTFVERIGFLPFVVYRVALGLGLLVWVAVA